jgi:NAD(P) transhydrogenase
MEYSSEVDVLVIGSGPGGEGAAMGASKAGLSVAVVDRHQSPGGACTHWGTIPSKSLRSAVHRLTQFQTDPLFAQFLVGNDVSFPDLLRNAASVITKQTQMRRGFYDRNMGVLIRHNEVLDHVEARDDCVLLHLESGKIIKDDVLLYAQGRSANGDKLGMENIGLAADSRGRIEVGPNFRTNLEHIYAVGDVVGAPSLASASYDQGRFAAAHMVDPDVDHEWVEDFPNGIYTSPEISSVGRTERELTEAKVPYEVGHSFFRSLARAQITGQTTGMLKILFHRETKEVLGVHCFGQNAAEIIHIGQAIMRQPSPHNTIEYFTRTTFNYPTMAEAYRVAALNGLNRVF